MKKTLSQFCATLLVGAMSMTTPALCAFAEDTAVATPTTEEPAYTFADYYAMSDEALLAALDFDYTTPLNSANLRVWYAEADLADRDALVDQYALETPSPSSNIDPDLLDDFCNQLGEIPSAYIANVVFDPGSVSLLGQEVYDPVTGETTTVSLYYGYLVEVAMPEGYHEGDDIALEQAKVIAIIQQLILDYSTAFDVDPMIYAIAPTPEYTGDINWDFEVNLQDLILLEKALADVVELTEGEIARADCNGNGGLDADDAYQLLLFLTQEQDSLGA